MALILNDIIQIKTYCFLNSQIGINTYHYRITAVSTPMVIGDIADGMDEQLSLVLKPLITDTALYVGTTAQKIRPANEAVAISKISQSFGTGGTAAGPLQV